MLPGQEVNVLDVPIEWKSREHHSRSRSSSSSFICTLDPEDRYLKPGASPKAGTPRRPTSPSVSAIRNHIIRKPVPNKAPSLPSGQTSSHIILDTPPRSSRASIVEENLAENKSFFIPESKRASFWSAIRPYRGIRSAFTSHGLDFRCKAATGRQQLRPHTSPTVGICRAQGTGSFAPASVPYVSTGAEESVPSANYLLASPDKTEVAATSAHKNEAESFQVKGVAVGAEADVPALDHTVASCGQSADQRQEQLPSSADWEPLGRPEIAKLDIGASLTIALSQLQVSQTPSTNVTQESNLGPPSGPGSGPAAAEAQSILEGPTIVSTLTTAAAHDGHSGNVATKLYRSSSSQYTMNDLFSPSLSTASAFTGPMSPYHLSQPGTPLLNEFGDDALAANPSDVWSSPMPGVAQTHSVPPVSHVASSDNGSFQGYSLPPEEQTSSLKPLEPASQAFNPRDRLEPKTGKQLVESWNDGSVQPTTGMKELLEDLGYLGRMIA